MFKVYEGQVFVTIPANVQALGFAVSIGSYFGCLKRLVVKQTDASNLQNFTVNVYSLPVVPLAPGQSPLITNVPLEAVRVLPQQTATAGNAVYVVEPGFGYAFMNKTTGIAQAKRELYVHISQGATPTVATNWCISYAVLEAA